MNIFEYTYAGLVAELGRRYGKGVFHAAAIYRRLYRELDLNVAGLPELAESPEFAARLERDMVTTAGRVVLEKEQDGVLKFVTLLDDGLKIESVVLTMVHHKTVCVSSQAGCRASSAHTRLIVMSCRPDTSGISPLFRLAAKSGIWELAAR